MSIEKKIGENLNLNLQLHDGEDTMPKRVFVDLFDSEGTKLVDKQELEHKDGGLFLEKSAEKIAMPDTKDIIARYVVFEADGLTFSEDHADVDERYQKQVEFNIPTTIIPKPFAVVASVRQHRVRAVVNRPARISVKVRSDE